MEIKQCLLTNNDCYKEGRTIKPSGIVVHTTGAENKTLRRYVQPDDGILGKNTYNNDWNRSGIEACVHAFIGEDKNGVVRCYQTLPWTMRCWGVGSGSKGSYNNSHIQFEICEGSSSDTTYAKAAYTLAVDLCVYLCKLYDLTADNICGHYEAYQRRYGSNHSDPKAYFAKFGYSMDGLRQEVKAKLSGSTSSTASASSGTAYTVAKGDTLSSIAAKYGTTYQVLAKYNGIADANKISVGQIIRIPSTNSSAGTSGSDNAAKTESNKVKYTKALQEALNAAYSAGLAVDGSAGPLTQAAIDKHYLYYKTPTIKNAHVSWLQDTLKALGYAITVDGSYGPATQATVKQFQKNNGLTVDGYAGVKTHLMILSLL